MSTTYSLGASIVSSQRGVLDYEMVPFPTYRRLNQTSSERASGWRPRGLLLPKLYFRGHLFELEDADCSSFKSEASRRFILTPDLHIPSGRMYIRVLPTWGAAGDKA